MVDRTIIVLIDDVTLNFRLLFSRHATVAFEDDNPWKSGHRTWRYRTADHRLSAYFPEKKSVGRCGTGRMRFDGHRSLGEIYEERRMGRNAATDSERSHEALRVGGLLGDGARGVVVPAIWRDCGLPQRRMAGGRESSLQLANAGGVRMLSAVGFDATDVA